MTIKTIKAIVLEIVAEAQKLSIAHTNMKAVPVNYACIFSQDDKEYDDLLCGAKQLGRVVQNTAMGPVFQIAPLATVAGSLALIKIRRPDPKRPERGDADFTIADYDGFKKAYLRKPGFTLIKRPEMEMLELSDSKYSVLAYFSHPTLADVLKNNSQK